MRISGFSFARNAQKLYYPVAESIRSILPICDEFHIAIGKGDDDDRTREIVEGIGDPKVNVIDTVWEDRERLRGHIHGQQTNIALRECTGDWCFYVQGDEVVHERDLSVVRKACEKYLHDREVEGLLFRYRHFWGDYRHHHLNHAWYPREIRVIRNGVRIESWESAQSFRRSGRKIRVVEIDAEIFHYGWVRPPRLMRAKQLEFSTTHWGRRKAEERFGDRTQGFNYGSLARVPRFGGTHPAVMKEWIEKMDWEDQLQQTGSSPIRFKHDRFKYRLLTFLEQKLLGGRQLGGFKNYILLKGK